MLRIAAVGLALIVVAPFQPDGARAQDIAGMEDCTKTPGLDKRTGCFQSNVNFLHQLVTKNALEARQRLNAANNEIVALKAALASLQTRVEQLQAAQKAANEKKPPAKWRGSPATGTGMRSGRAYLRGTHSYLTTPVRKSSRC